MFAEPSSTTCETSAVKPRESKRRSNGVSGARAHALERRAGLRVHPSTVSRWAAVCLLLFGPLFAGCSTLISSMTADTLSASILNQDDPELLKSGLPAYLLLVDGLIYRSPDSAGLLAAGAQLFALYGSRFAESEARSATLTAKARRYGERAICLTHTPACEWRGMPFEQFGAQLNAVESKQIDELFAFGVSWLANLDATSSDWTAVAELPWAEAALERALALDETYQNGAIHGYLGILNTLRPPALGGRPEIAKEHFERAVELGGGRDLSIKVEYARRYARLVFDQELHDRLLTEVLDSPVDAPGLTLFNVLAKQEAEALLASSKEYF